MAVYAVGDVHGQADALKLLIQKLELQSDDHIIFLGDYVDRGPDWFEAVKYITELESICQVTALWGNHDVLMYDSLKLFNDCEICPDIGSEEKQQIWFYNGGRETYNKFVGLSAVDKQFTADFFGKLQVDIDLSVNDREYTLCHSLPGKISGSLWDAVWARLSWNKQGKIYCDSKIDVTALFENYKNRTIIHGHTPVFNYIDLSSDEQIGAFKYNLGDVAFIDIDLAAGSIGRFDGANICALRLDDMREFYGIE